MHFAIQACHKMRRKAGAAKQNTFLFVDHHFKVQLNHFFGFVLNYLLYNSKHFCENVFDFGPIIFFFHCTLKFERG